MEFTFKADLWEWKGEGAWCFVSVPKDFYEDLREVAGSVKKGFGSVKVEVSVGSSIWRTSVFPDTKSKTFVLPIKKAIRKAESLNIGDEFSLKLRLIEA